MEDLRRFRAGTDWHRPPLHARDPIGVDLEQGLYALDSTTIDLCPSRDDPKTPQGILSAVSAPAVEFEVFFPIHPRTRKNIEIFGLVRYLANAEGRDSIGIVPLDPLGYLDFLSLNDRARIVRTDSGRVQEETTVLGVPCLTLRENTERPATIQHGSNQLVGVDSDRILAAARSIFRKPARQPQRSPMWDGKAAPRIVAIIREHLQRDDLA